MATQAEKEAFRLKWHRARMYEKGMSREAVQRKIATLQNKGKLPERGSTYKKWRTANTMGGGKVLAPDNGKSPWRNFVNKGGASKIKDALDLGYSERQERYKKRRVSNEAIQRRIKAQRNQKNTTGR